jgi:RHS repeat-associated protein
LAGQYFDGESYLHYNHHRYYNPITGRYIKSDPIGLIGDINVFTYSSNRPAVMSDPEGLSAYLRPLLGASIGAFVNNMNFRDDWIEGKITDRQFVSILGAGAIAGGIAASGKDFLSGLAKGTFSGVANDMAINLILRDPCKEWTESDVDSLMRTFVVTSIKSLIGGAVGGSAGFVGKVINIPGVKAVTVGTITGISAEAFSPIFLNNIK